MTYFDKGNLLRKTKGKRPFHIQRVFDFTEKFKISNIFFYVLNFH